jgi:hypothetical protein
MAAPGRGAPASAARPLVAVREAVPRVYVYFDKPLYPADLWEGNWFLRIDGRLQLLSAAIAFSTHVQIDTTPGGGLNPGPDRVRYLGLTPDLRCVDLLFVVPFYMAIVRT